MSRSIVRGEVSEVVRVQILRTESRLRACARTMYIAVYKPMYMGLYNVHDVRANHRCYGREIGCKTSTYKHLNAFEASLVLSTANLAKQGRNLAFLSRNLAVTSPHKPHKTLGFYQKARLARLEVDIPRIEENDVHTHVHVHSPYRRVSEITSLDLANLANGFSRVCARLSPAISLRTTLPHVARSHPSRPTRCLSHSSRQLANSRPTTRLPEWHSVSTPSPQRMGPPPKLTAPLGCGNSRAISHSLFVLSDPQFPAKRIAL